jgi:signal peptidase II
MSLARRNDLIMVATGILVIILDQLVKQWITQYFRNGAQPIPILGSILELIYVQNSGVAFSLLEGRESLYVLIAIAVAVIVWLYWRLRNSSSLLIKVIFGLIIGGAIGNLLDRLRLGYVVDFGSQCKHEQRGNA